MDTRRTSGCGSVDRGSVQRGVENRIGNDRGRQEVERTIREVCCGGENISIMTAVGLVSSARCSEILPAASSLTTAILYSICTRSGSPLCQYQRFQAVILVT